MTDLVERARGKLRAFRSTLSAKRLDESTGKFIRKFFEEDYPGCSSRGEVGFVIEPWPAFPELTSFIVALALAFIKRGRRICFIWDDCLFGPDQKLELNIQMRIRRILSNIPQPISCLRLSDFEPAEGTALDESTLQLLASLNTCRHYLTESPPVESSLYRHEISRTMSEASRRADALLRNHPFDFIIVPGGVYRLSGIFLKAGQRRGVRVASFDSGPSVLLTSTDGVAAYLEDIPKALAALPPEDTWVLEQARQEFARRMKGVDRFAYQGVAASGTSEWRGVLIPLNQSYDTAALGRHQVFRDQTEWMLESVAWILEHSNEQVLIRRHPIERNPEMKSRDDYWGQIEARFGVNPRIRYVGAGQSVNTYDLLAGTRLLLAHVSTIGVEAATLGVPVVTQSSSYYANMGFVNYATSRAEYFDFIRRALSGDLIVTDEQSDNAWRCYYLTQCCNLFPTSFTPGLVDSWIQQPPDVVLGADSLDMVCYSLAEDIPLSLLVAQAAREKFSKGD